MNKKGFTLIELLLTVIIAVVLSAVTYLNYSGKKAGTDLSSTVQQVATLVREAQSRTLAGDQNGTSGNGFWGVQFSNTTNTPPFFSLFYATSTAGLASGAVVGRYRLPSTVAYATSTIAASGTLYVYYSSGFVPGIPPGVYGTCVGYSCPVGTTTIQIGIYTLNQKPMMSSTISIVPSGGVSY